MMMVMMVAMERDKEKRENEEREGGRSPVVEHRDAKVIRYTCFSLLSHGLAVCPLGLVGVGVSCGQPASSSQHPAASSQRPASQPASQPAQPSPALHHLHHHPFVSRLVSRLSSLSPPLDLGRPVPVSVIRFIALIAYQPRESESERAKSSHLPCPPAAALREKKKERKKKKSWELKGVINPSFWWLSPHLHHTSAERPSTSDHHIDRETALPGPLSRCADHPSISYQPTLAWRRKGSPLTPPTLCNQASRCKKKKKTPPWK